jgi:tricorn protease
MSQAYFRFPTVFQDKIAFISEDDLWEVSVHGGAARRLTAGRGSFSHPLYSPGGRWLALASTEEGHDEIYVTPAEGGDLRRLTYLGSSAAPAAWLDEETILFRTAAVEPHHIPTVCKVSVHGGLPESLRFGPAVNIAISDAGQAVLERNGFRSEPAHWKRYRGGRTGKLWIAPSLDGEFKALIQPGGNLTRPLWAQGRVYFVSDHEGVGNLYSCTAEGGDLRRETSHSDFYVRNPSTDGQHVAYHAGGDLYLFDVARRSSRRLDVDYRGQRTQRQRRFISAQHNVENAQLDPKGERIVFDARGQIHLMRNWEGPALNCGEPGVRYRLACFLADGRRAVAAASKDSGDEWLILMDTEDGSVTAVTPETCAALNGQAEPGVNWGRFVDIRPSPKGDRIAFSNHRNEVWTLDLASGVSRMLGVNAHRPMGDFAWSPDGRWLAHPQSEALRRQHLRIANVETGESRQVTEALFDDSCPSFDPEGRYLYFLSERVLDPVHDEIQFELSFIRTTAPCLVTLRKDKLSPFLDAEVAEDASDGKNKEDGQKDKEQREVEIEIDFDGISERILTFPGASPLRYAQIVGLKKKVMWLWFSTPVEADGDDDDSWTPSGVLECFDFKTLSSERLAGGVGGVSVSADGKQMLLDNGGKLRVVKAGEKPPPAPDKAGRKSGLIDLQRARTLIDPAAEWRQMLYEAWRLQRDHFWREDMADVDWSGVLKRYEPLVERVNCRSEFDDLLWEMQGELGTSHAYSMGGDYRPRPHCPVGFLGADFAYDEASGGYRIERFLKGDPWKASEACPLRAPGVLLSEGDALTAIDGQNLDAEVTPHQALFHRAGSEVWLSVQGPDKTTRRVRVRTLRSEQKARYRDWVEANRAYVEKAGGGRVGYIHIPDMSSAGFAEFHRHFLRDYGREGLIVDVRYNRGGNVSQLLLEKLCRKRLAMRGTRWFGMHPYPYESPAGPMAALTNEYAGSDGDIFSHTFKLRKAGPLIGRRTWGGVIGIMPRHELVDGGWTTQPEFATWFVDVGWKVENYGVDPDIDVDIAPHEFRRGVDPQLDRGVEEVLKLIEAHEPLRPEPEERPSPEA